MRANILYHGLLPNISDCVVELTAAVSASARAGKTDWTAPDCLGRFHYDFANESISFEREWHTKSLKRGLCEDALQRTVNAKHAPCCADKLRDAYMSQGYAEAVWACYKANVTDLWKILSLEVPRAFLRNLDTELVGNAPKGMYDEENSLVFQGMVPVKEVALSALPCKLREVQCVCEDGRASVPKTIVEVVAFDREGVEAKCKNATLSEQNTDMEAILVNACAKNVRCGSY